jgi:hypothetical protein
MLLLRKFKIDNSDNLPIKDLRSNETAVKVPIVIPEVIEPYVPDLEISGIRHPELKKTYIDIEAAEKIVLPIARADDPIVFDKTVAIAKTMPDVKVEEIIEVVQAEQGKADNEDIIFNPIPIKKVKDDDKVLIKPTLIEDKIIKKVEEVQKKLPDVPIEEIIPIASRLLSGGTIVQEEIKKEVIYEPPVSQVKKEVIVPILKKKNILDSFTDYIYKLIYKK